MDSARQVPLLAGRYRLGSVIGQGGMGVVWRARDELLSRDVAIKEIVSLPDLSDSDRADVHRRAVLEAQMAGQLSHPNVVGIYDILTQDGRPWIVMELVPYPSLGDIVRGEGPLSPARAARTGVGILAALGAAHAKEILHRDVKPANVLVGPHGRVVLTDFGIACPADGPALTTVGQIVGSPPYISPERARGERASMPGDMWGLGATLYAAVAGRPPFERDNPIATLTALVDQDPDPVPGAGPLWPVISGLLRKDPAERLDAAGANAMLRDIVIADAPSGPVLPEPRASSESSLSLESPLSLDPALLPEPVSLPDSAPVSTLVSEPVPRSEPVLPAQPSGPRRRRRTTVTVAVVAALLAIGAASGAGVLLAHETGGNRTAAAGPRPSPARPSATASSASPRRASSASSTPGAAARGDAGAALPAQFYRFTNSTGFSIAVPRGWQISHVGHYVYIKDPANAGVYLLIDQSDQPKSDPLADWRQQAANRADSYPDYHLIRLESVSYPQAAKAADWEFTYDRDGVPVHILSRNVLANAAHAYALYWSTPQSDWTGYYRYFRAFAASFRPAPA